MNKIYTLLFCAALSTCALAQDKAAAANPKNVYTSIRPADGQPAVFSSQEELNAKVPSKISGIKAEISNQSDSVAVRALREQLWRFENAAVSKPKGNK